MKLHIENSIVIEMNGKTATLGCGEYEFDSASEFIKFIESLGDEPKQPLIKDEKIRKAVRAWAKANGEEDNIVFTRSCEYSDYMFYTNGGGDICFEQAIDLTTGSYTITELCGEEEE